MVRWLFVPVLMSALLAAPPVRAQEAEVETSARVGTGEGTDASTGTGAGAAMGGIGGQGWSVQSGQLVGSGRVALHTQVGYPGLSFGLVGGVANRFDLGGRLTYNYAIEGLTRGENFDPQLKLQALLRFGLIEGSRFNMAVHFEPGPLVYFEKGVPHWGLSLPAGLAFGFPIGSAVMVNAGLDLPVYVLFGAGLYLPILFGGGVEYYIDRSLSLTMNLRMGPTIKPDQRPAEFTLNWLLGVAYRF